MCRTFLIEIKGLASYCKAETTFTFHFSILTLSNAFVSMNNKEMKVNVVLAEQWLASPFRSTKEMGEKFMYQETENICTSPLRQGKMVVQINVVRV